MDDIHAAVQASTDRAQITSTLRDYAQAIDRGDIEPAVRCFACRVHTADWMLQGKPMFAVERAQRLVPGQS